MSGFLTFKNNTILQINECFFGNKSDDGIANINLLLKIKTIRICS